MTWQLKTIKQRRQAGGNPGDVPGQVGIGGSLSSFLVHVAMLCLVIAIICTSVQLEVASLVGANLHWKVTLLEM